MNSKEVALVANCTLQNIQKKTKQAVDRDENVISVKGRVFLFEMVRDGRGKSYRYFESLKEMSDENTSGQPKEDNRLQGRESNLQGVEDSAKEQTEVSDRSKGISGASERWTVCGSGGVSSIGSEQSKGAAGVVEVVEDTELALKAQVPLSMKVSDAKRVVALEKKRVIDEWKRQKGKLKMSAFCEYINSEEICSQKVTANKLFAWQRAYKKDGLDGLVDKRSSNKKSLLKELGLEEDIKKFLYAQRGHINIANIHQNINFLAIKKGKLDALEYLGKKDEIVSYKVVNKWVNNYLNENKILKDLIIYGEDGAISHNLSALGKSNWAVDGINQVVEIDASPLDAMCNREDLSDKVWQRVRSQFDNKDEFKESLKKWHKRCAIIQLIDTYSGVGVYLLGDTENSLSIIRAVAKYISKFGKPRVIKGDNGKAFLSKYCSDVLAGLDIEYQAVRAYSGWLKPYVERGFKSLQNSFTENLAGYIGHNITQRQGIEFFFSKKERRLKKGYKTNVKNLTHTNHIQHLMDLHVDKIMHNSYLERLGMSPRESYEMVRHEAQWMDEVSLSMALSPREEKSVLKGKVSLNGVYYYNIVMSAYSKVKVSINANDISSCYVWDMEDNFIGVGKTLDMEEGVSVEEAKAARKLVEKRIKIEKKKMSEASVEVVAFREEFLEDTDIPTIKSETPAVPDAVNVEIQAANNLMASGGEEYLEELAKEKKKEEKKESLEDIVLGRLYG